jgi:hypothetical protein
MAMAVGVVANDAKRGETNRSVLRCMLPSTLHGNLEEYLGQATSFEYVQFEYVFDVRCLKKTCEELLVHGQFENPGHPWMGLLQAK